MKIATWNANSINIRLPQLIEWTTKNQLDVVCLQETKCTDDRFPQNELAEIGYHTAFMGQKSYNGVAILSKHPIEDVQYNMPDDDADAPKRFIAATIGGIRIVNTYVPNGSELGSDKFDFKLKWLQRLRHYFNENCAREKDVLLCGDFNVAYDERDVVDAPLMNGKLHFTKTERAAIEYVRQWGFTDLFRQFTRSSGHYTWWHYKQGGFLKNIGLRIDYIWTSPSLTARAAACRIDREPRGGERPSDHAPVVAEFNF